MEPTKSTNDAMALGVENINTLDPGNTCWGRDSFALRPGRLFGNMGNYKSFGDTKFVPDVPQDRLKLFLSCSCMNSDLFNTYFDATVERMYSLPHRHRQVGSILFSMHT